MLYRQKIELFKDEPGPPQTLIPRETLAESAQASQLLGRAHAQADALLAQAEEQCEQLLEQAGAEFWQRANTQLKRWEQDRQQMCENLERYATAVTNQAIHTLLEDTVEPQRLSALLKQLLAIQLPASSATLLCHPHELEGMKLCLALHQATLWNLQPDDTLKPQTLVLKTDDGDFRISWSAMLETLSKPNNAA